ncbi:MAG: hypothetical protein ACJ0RG_12710 [Candidatus Azotimanducaceae bacterium]
MFDKNDATQAALALATKRAEALAILARENFFQRLDNVLYALEANAAVRDKAIHSAQRGVYERPNLPRFAELLMAHNKVSDFCYKEQRHGNMAPWYVTEFGFTFIDEGSLTVSAPGDTYGRLDVELNGRLVFRGSLNRYRTEETEPSNGGPTRPRGYDQRRQVNRTTLEEASITPELFVSMRIISDALSDAWLAIESEKATAQIQDQVRADREALEKISIDGYEPIGVSPKPRVDEKSYFGPKLLLFVAGYLLFVLLIYLTY